MSLNRRGHSYCACPARWQYSHACGDVVVNGEDEATMERATGMQSPEPLGARAGAEPPAGWAGGLALLGGGSQPGGVAYSPEKKAGCVRAPCGPRRKPSRASA